MDRTTTSECLLESHAILKIFHNYNVGATDIRSSYILVSPNDNPVVRYTYDWLFSKYIPKVGGFVSRTYKVRHYILSKFCFRKVCMNLKCP